MFLNQRYAICQHGLSNSAQNKTCGRTIKQPSGWIASPDTDSDSLYDFNMHCNWTVEAGSNDVIRFLVLYVEIQFNNPCYIGDYLEVYVSPSTMKNLNVIV